MLVTYVCDPSKSAYYIIHYIYTIFFNQAFCSRHDRVGDTTRPPYCIPCDIQIPTNFWKLWLWHGGLTYTNALTADRKANVAAPPGENKHISRLDC